jgi:integrase
MGLRLEEALSLQVGDIDAGRKRVHIRRGKGHKSRLVPLPHRTLEALRLLWRRHRHPVLIFPNAMGSFKTMQRATTHMFSNRTDMASPALWMIYKPGKLPLSQVPRGTSSF